MGNKKGPEKLNIYAQDMWHDEALVMSTKKGLQDLRDAIDTAIEDGSGVLEASASDGVRYDVYVVLKEEDDKEWDEVELPYVEDVTREIRGYAEKGKEYLIGDIKWE